GFVGHFGEGFAELAARHRVALVGGDTTQGPLSITVTALGMVPKGEAMTRSGARAGDAVFVTGTLGDAAGALRLTRDPGLGARDSDRQAAAPPGSILFQRMHRPQPRVGAGLALRSFASACIDISDGLLADLGHVCKASGVGIEIELDALPVSAALRETFDEASCRELASAGGDDYELAFSVPEDRAGEASRRLAAVGCAATRIGRVIEGSGIRVLDAHGQAIETPRTGWEHFAQ
ncbi:MAG TPA: thiamine-phosphate kinase, partial [Rhodanobacteraceae bacterium]|nr:thiamine-phosphate kinase [Rhodanobacteraceae bacterium]